MSNIYRALEKAQREREKGWREGRDAPVMPKEPQEERAKSEACPLGPSATGLNPDLVCLFQAGSLAAEQFRKLRTHLLRFRIPDPPKTIMITSATSGEGKTLVSINLAAGIAHELNAHALLLECDMRNPSVSQWFDLENGKEGLGDYLSGDRISFSDLLINTEMEKLKLVVGGTIREKPAELIGSRKMEALIRELRSRYSDRYVIFDATPLLATTEPEILSKLVDGVIIVVRAGVTPREMLRQAIAPLEKEKILGFVLNDVEFKSPGLHSRYFGSNGYYHGYGQKRAPTKGPRSLLQRHRWSPFRRP